MPIKYIRLYVAELLSGRFAYLLATQLVLFLTYPFLNSGNVVGQVVLEVIYLSVLLSCLRVLISDARPLRIVVITLLVLIVGFRIGEHLVTFRGVLEVGLSLDILFHMIVCVAIIAHVMKTERVNTDKILGACSAYLFIGVMFSLIFALLDTLAPGSFSHGSHAGTLGFLQQGVARGMSFLYFSFITLTTVGYGDVVPMTQAADALAAMEAVVGQLYLTVLLARLVGLNIAYNSQKAAESVSSARFKPSGKAETP
ncbi:MAG: potassium channel family protein [Kiritimatiellae bacterium]|nr:potassium channel family protein [Kiritimatiellia bacterium]